MVVLTSPVRRGPALLVLVCLIALTPRSVAQGTWIGLEPGLSLMEYQPPGTSAPETSPIIFLRADPRRFELRLLSSSGQNHQNLSAREWATRYGLLACINAGMYREDYRTNVGFMQNGSHANNTRVTKSYQSVCAYGPTDASKPPFRLFDTEDTPVRTIAQSYRVVVQNLRLIKRTGVNRWYTEGREWSEAALAEDSNGNIVFVFSRSPYSMRKFNDILLSSPVRIVAAQHLDGGPVASIVINHPQKSLHLTGGFETGFTPPNGGGEWPIPNVFGLVRIPKR